MKSIATRLALIAATVMITAVPVLADEVNIWDLREQERGQKDECLLVAKNCLPDTTQERIERIQNEISRGTAVYTTDELRHLNKELEESQKLLEEEMTHGGA